ncbi:hypothetical protein AAG570_002937 [Ranatra chinensis]|uniref:Nucleoporin Nup133/Nup155-like N-terminal domain-containing protein n=1 Tax=Ranatra chinensis TaxID=642074 RepID=A0ABD0YTT5_9HEMI
MGRIFMGGKDGSLFEIVYQNEIGWWGQRCKKVNHSKGALSYLLPAFINSAFYEDDAIVQIAVDNSRNILYTLTEKSSIEVFDLGADGLAMARVASITHSTLLNHIGTIVNFYCYCSTLDMKEISKVVTLCPLEVTDSQEIGVVGVTESGVRLYLSTGYSYPHRPSTLHVVHVRLPTGYSSNSEVFNPSQVISSIQKRGMH